MDLFHADFAQVKPREIAPGFRGRYLHSDQITQGRVDIEAGALLPEHSHPHEQWTTIITGTLEITVSGSVQVLQPGHVLFIPPHQVHSGRALTACQVIDVFHPVREDYR
jgi:quercetin dioxygenase-like cupin family protein